MAVYCLTANEKREIFRLFNLGRNKTDIGNMFDVSARTVGRVIDEMVSVPREELEFEDEVELPGWSQECCLGDDQQGAWYEDAEGDLAWSGICDWDKYHGYDEDDEEEPNYEYFVVANLTSVMITRIDPDSGYSRQVSVTRDMPRFHEISDIVWAGRASQDSLEMAFELADQKTFIEKYTDGFITVDPEANCVYYEIGNQRREIHGKLVPRLLDALSKGTESTEFMSLIQFTEKLLDNPSKKSIDELYDFLEAMDITITDDGMVECFKRVRANYTDCHTGTFDNSVGKIVQVPRHMVDADSFKTCSYGLHVCSKSYLGSFWGDRIIKVLVDPADFVSIPEDYYGYDADGQVKAKARVCRYKVISEIDSY